MKGCIMKTLVAAAAAMVALGSAQAASSVTLYGLLDTGYGYSQVKLDRADYRHEVTQSGAKDGIFGGNRWGLKGSEDLGSGVRAIFTLESAFNINNGQGLPGGFNPPENTLFGRLAFVGVASDEWGRLTMGRQNNVATDFTYNSNFSVDMGDVDAAFGGQGMRNRINNSFKYLSPVLGGFQAGLVYGSLKTDIVRGTTDGYMDGGEFVRTDSDRSHWLSTGVSYTHGPLQLAASFDRVNKTGSDAHDVINWAVTGIYDFEVVKLALAYGQDRYDKLAWTNFAGDPFDYFSASLRDSNDEAWNDFKSRNYYVGVSAPVAGGLLALSWSRTTSNLSDAYLDGSPIQAKAQTVYHANYLYPLSKRTSLYVYGSYGTGIGYVDNMKGRELGVGLNHVF